MLAEWGKVFGGAGIEDDVQAAGVVSWAWREKNALVEATVRAEGELVDLEDAAVRRELERMHAALLAEHGMDHLDVSQLRSKDRIVTQTISRGLYEKGFAGIRFRSNLDDRECFALFEGRASLEPTGREPEPLTGDAPELLQVASDYGLVLKRVVRDDARLRGLQPSA